MRGITTEPARPLQAARVDGAIEAVPGKGIGDKSSNGFQVFGFPQLFFLSRPPGGGSEERPPHLTTLLSCVYEMAPVTSGRVPSRKSFG
jgi:hypothetical protein